MRWRYRLTFAESNRLVDGVGCPSYWVINSVYRYWHVTYSVPRCVLISVTCSTNSSAILSNLHVSATLIRTPARCRAIVTFGAALTLSTVHQWAGCFVVAQWASLPDWGICCPRPLLPFIVLRCHPLCHASCYLTPRFSDHPRLLIIPESLLTLTICTNT